MGDVGGMVGGSANISLVRRGRFARVTRGTICGFKTLLWSTILITMPLYAVALVLEETQGAENIASLGPAFFTACRRSASMPGEGSSSTWWRGSMDGLAVPPTASSRHLWSSGSSLALLASSSR